MDILLAQLKGLEGLDQVVHEQAEVRFLDAEAKVGLVHRESRVGHRTAQGCGKELGLHPVEPLDRRIFEEWSEFGILEDAIVEGPYQVLNSLFAADTVKES